MWLRRPRVGPSGWRLVGIAVAALAGTHGVLGAFTLGAVRGIYGTVGGGLAAACVAVVALPAALGAAVLWRMMPRWRWRGAPLLTLMAGYALALVAVHRAGMMCMDEAWTRADVEEIDTALHSLRPVVQKLKKPRSARPLAVSATAQCPAPLAATATTVLAHYLNHRGRPRAACFVVGEGETLGGAVATHLRREAARGPIVVDVVTSAAPFVGGVPLVSSLQLRPGLDGACLGRRCLTPWQLLSMGAFSERALWAWVPDVRFGVSEAWLRQALAEPEPGEVQSLVRFGSRSFVLYPEAVALSRMRPIAESITDGFLRHAGMMAQSHLLGAQRADGRFRYGLDPFIGTADDSSFSLARHAGVTLALCELGEDSEQVRESASKALAVFQAHRRDGPLPILTTDAAAADARLGENALPLAALVSCSERFKLPRPQLVGELTHALMRMQRPDGGFFARLRLADAIPYDQEEPLYSGGQATLALALLAAERAPAGGAAGEAPAAIRSALSRAMEYYGQKYYRHPLREFFFIEENWHCIAARAALSVLRSPSYEQLCRDYVDFKLRLMLDENDGVHPDYWGGFGIGNVVPPHNTGAAGLGEALAALVLIEDAEGHVVPTHLTRLRKILGFVARQQWRSANCYACAAAQEVIGGFSEQIHAPFLRIDYTQHAWAALEHGRRSLAVAAPGAAALDAL